MFCVKWAPMHNTLMMRELPDKKDLPVFSEVIKKQSNNRTLVPCNISSP